MVRVQRSVDLTLLVGHVRIERGQTINLPGWQQLGLKYILLQRSERVCQLEKALAGLLQGFEVRLPYGRHVRKVGRMICAFIGCLSNKLRCDRSSGVSVIPIEPVSTTDLPYILSLL